MFIHSPFVQKNITWFTLFDVFTFHTQFLHQYGGSFGKEKQKKQTHDLLFSR